MHRPRRAPRAAGEFSERAFLNGKLDLAQAEAVADLIAAARHACRARRRRALDGVFSERVDAVATELLHPAHPRPKRPIDARTNRWTRSAAPNCAKAWPAARHICRSCSPTPNADASCATDCMQ
jgi:hypothetical protein